MTGRELGWGEKKSEPSPQAVREALARILSSEDFDATDRLRNFLTYVVEETLQGRPSRIKGYNIATSVFGRDDSFDPQVDSIVRIVAGRLRRSLEHYYLTSGRSESIQIHIPKGSYVPTFDQMIQDPPVAATPQEDRRPIADGGPSIFVEAFTEEGDHSAFPHFVTGLTRLLVVGLSRFSGLRIFGPEAGTLVEGAEAMKAAYVLRGGAAITGERFWVDIVFAEQRSGRTIWADSFERSMSPGEIFSLRNEVANRIVQMLAQPYGIISSDRAKDSEGSPPDQLGSYGCVLRFHQYWRTFDPQLLPEVRRCLELTVRREPGYADAFACLSLIYSNTYRFHGDTVPPDSDLLDRALALADRAVELAPNSSWSHYARSLAYWFIYDLDSSIASLEAARAINPNDTAITADLGQRYAMLGKWDRAIPLLEESYARNPAQPGGYRIGLFLYHYAHGRYEEALMQARKMGSLVIYGPVAVAMAAAELGRDEEAARAVRRIMAIDPDYGDHVLIDLEKRSLRPDLVGMVVDGLRKAGLPGRDLSKTVSTKAFGERRRRPYGEGQ
ncbi:tetratricopeptide repeat protein [Mesorhizobium sp. ASY16-5R]|uniref:tetratricopeptide repeat protein n=1 Tax=Mesorhizobium sp. ASY16-5R TaxID=3445772 RepID=UPI003F9F5484